MLHRYEISKAGVTIGEAGGVDRADAIKALAKELGYRNIKEMSDSVPSNSGEPFQAKKLYEIRS